MNNNSLDTIQENDDDNSVKSSVENNSTIAVCNDNDLDEILSINTNIDSDDETNNNKIYVTNMKSKEELELDSKLVTEREIYNLGIIQATKKKKKKNMKKNLKFYLITIYNIIKMI